MKTVNPIGEYTIIKIETKTEPHGEEQKRSIEKVSVFLTSPEVILVHPGDEVLLAKGVYNDFTRVVNPFAKKTVGDDEYYIAVKEEEIIGVFE